MDASDKMTLAELARPPAAKANTKAKAKAKAKTKSNAIADLSSRLGEAISQQQSELYKHAKEIAESKLKREEEQRRNVESKLKHEEEQRRNVESKLKHEGEQRWIAENKLKHEGEQRWIAENKLKHEEQQRRNAEMLAVKRGEQVIALNDHVEQARQLAQRETDRLALAEKQARRLELDFSEASSTLERLSKVQKKEAVPMLELGASLTLVDKLEAPLTPEDKAPTRKEKQNARRRGMKKHKQDRMFVMNVMLI